MIDKLKPLLGKLCSFSQKRLGFSHPPKLFLKSDSENAEKTLGKTAHYDPNNSSITLFTTGRHPKDILRSFSHELVHHAQNLRGDLAPEKMTSTGANYAQECPHMRNMEKEAYLKGNMCFRDWEDQYKLTESESKFLKENKTMTTKITKDFLKEQIKSAIKEFELRGQGKYSDYMSSLGSDSIKYQGTGTQTPPAKKPVAKKKPDLSNTVISHLQDFKTHVHKKYGVMPDFSDSGGFKSAFADAKALKVPFFYFGPGKYKIYATGLGKDPLSLDDLKAKYQEYGDEAMAQIEPEIDNLAATLNPKKEKPVVGSPLEETDEIEEGGCGKGGLGRRTDDKVKETKGIEEKKKCPGKSCPGCPECKPGLKNEQEELEEKKTKKKKKKKGKYDDGDGKDEKCDYVPCKESVIQTPEQENTLYEQRFTPKNNRLFEKLLQEWTK